MKLRFTDPTSLRTVMPASLTSVLLVSRCLQYITLTGTRMLLDVHTFLKLKHARRDIARPIPSSAVCPAQTSQSYERDHIFLFPYGALDDCRMVRIRYQADDHYLQSQLLSSSSQHSNQPSTFAISASRASALLTSRLIGLAFLQPWHSFFALSTVRQATVTSTEASERIWRVGLVTKPLPRRRAFLVSI